VATFQAIAATGGALLELLEGARPRPEFDNAKFLLARLSDVERNTPPLKEGVSLLLYRVEVNAARRNRPPRATLDGRHVRTGLPLELHYLLTAWAETAQKQQRLLGWCMQFLDEHAILPASLLNTTEPEADVFRPEETVEFVPESLSLQELANAWEFAQSGLQLSVGYVARVVELEPTAEPAAGAPVQTRQFEMAGSVPS
jgi:hypothetical protein